MTDAASAALILIGDEILTGKVDDTNSRYLIRVLRECGVDLARILVVADDLDEIAWAVRTCIDRYDHVFTSGGIGPTHDDLTSEGVALALGVAVARHPELESMLRDHFGERLTEDHLKMADVPEGTATSAPGLVRWPVIEPRPGLYMLPGIPQIFEAKVEALRARLTCATRATCRWVFTTLEEGRLAPFLGQLLEAHPDVTIGSYPVLGAPGFRVKVAIESRIEAAIDLAVDDLLARLPAGVAGLDPTVGG